MTVYKLAIERSTKRLETCQKFHQIPRSWLVRHRLIYLYIYRTLVIDHFNKNPEIKLNKLKWESTVHREQPTNRMYSEKRSSWGRKRRDAPCTNWQNKTKHQKQNFSVESECTWLKKHVFLGFNDGLFFSMECYVFIIDLFPAILIYWTWAFYVSMWIADMFNGVQLFVLWVNAQLKNHFVFCVYLHYKFYWKKKKERSYIQSP
jgi:hypothetical protein